MAENIIVTKDNQMFLNPAYLAEEIAQLQDEALWYTDLGFNRVSTRSNTVRWMEDPYSPGSDPKKRRAPARLASTFFKRMDISPVLFKSAVLTPYGLQFAVDEDTISDPSAVDYFTRARTAMAQWIAEQKNNQLADALTDNFDTSDDDSLNGVYAGAGYTSGGTLHIPIGTGWNQAAPDPIGDIIAISKIFKTQPRRRYLRCTDGYIPSLVFHDLYEYLLKEDNVTLPGVNPNNVDGTIKIAGITIHELNGTLTNATGDEVTDKGIWLDRRVSPLTIYDKYNPKYARAGDNMVNVYVDQASHDTMVQTWFNREVVRVVPNGIMMTSGMRT